MSSVALTTMTPTALGRMCRKMIRRSRAPDDACGVDELALAQA